MSAFLPYEIREAIVNVCGTAFYYKHALFAFLARAGVPENLFQSDEAEAKFVIARRVLTALEQMGDDGRLIQRRLLTQLCELKALPDAAAAPDKGIAALNQLKTLAAENDLIVREEQRQARRREDAAGQAEASTRQAKLGGLLAIFTEMASSEDRQARGYDLERLLTELFPLFGLRYRPPYRASGEQIDGSFHFRGFDYIVEARWRNHVASLADLLSFKGKVDRKIESTRGLFLSVSGFVSEAPERLRQAGSANLILMDGRDLALVLESRIGLVDAFESKADKASQEGRLLYPLAEALAVNGAVN